LLRAGGKFDRADLAEWVWNEQGHTVADQRLLLSMILSCGMCFPYRQGRRGVDDHETIYIAPDLLPPK